MRKHTKKWLNSSLSFLIALLLVSCKKEEAPVAEDPRIVSFVFEAANNPKQLLVDVAGTIDEEKGRIDFRISHVVTDKRLIPTIRFADEQTTIRVPEDMDTVDFSTPVTFTLENRSSGTTKDYTVSVHAFTGLPIVFIHTENDAAITSKEVYVKARIQIFEGIETRAGAALDEEVNIRGRGNTTWGLPKKPYALKFDKKTSLLGEPKDKSWVLLANYTDKTNLRNETSFFMGRISKLAWTPRSHFVELFLNEVYCGTYQLCEKIKIAESRVNVTDEGYLLEIDQPGRVDADDITFYTSSGRFFCVKDPDLERDGERHKWIAAYVDQAEQTLFGDNFLDPEKGYTAYFDRESFVDWYLINEITKNNDAILFSSCYVNLAPGGKLKMGPLWDFDLALGNINYNGNQSYEGFWVKNNANWFARMFEDPAFVALVKERFAYFKSKKNDILMTINDNAAYLQYSVVENNAKWGTLYHATWPNYAVWGSYDNEVQYLKNWLDKRFEWLDTAFSAL